MPPTVTESTPTRDLEVPKVPETSPVSVVRLDLSGDEVEDDTTAAPAVGESQLSLNSLPIYIGLISGPVLVLYWLLKCLYRICKTSLLAWWRNCIQRSLVALPFPANSALQSTLLDQATTKLISYKLLVIRAMMLAGIARRMTVRGRAVLRWTASSVTVVRTVISIVWINDVPSVRI